MNTSQSIIKFGLQSSQKIAANLAARTRPHILDQAESDLLHGNVCGGLTRLTNSLGVLRESVSQHEWVEFCEKACQEHAVSRLLHEDPFTKHAFDKPRRYPGDAELIDYMYGFKRPSSGVSELGNKIFNYATNSPAARSVRERRRIMAGLIDGVANDRPDPAIFSVACGHLREATISEAVVGGHIQEFVALDHDQRSLEVVKKELTKFGIKPVQASVIDLLSNKLELGSFDLIYTAGLYDYLPQPIAKRLTQRLFRRLRPAGRLVIGNFAPCLRDIGYLESFMQWKLIYRNEQEMLELVSSIPQEAIRDQRVFWDGPGNVVYLDIARK